MPFSGVAPMCAVAGLGNFKEFLVANPITTALFRKAIVHDLFLIASVTAGTIMMVLPLALALDRRVRGQSVFRTLMMLPMVTVGIAVY